MTNHPPSVLWHCWLGHQICKNRWPYNLYCVGADVKPCSINASPHPSRALLSSHQLIKSGVVRKWVMSIHAWPSPQVAMSVSIWLQLIINRRVSTHTDDLRD